MEHLLFRIHKIEVYCFTGNNAIENIVCSLLLRSIPFAKHKDDGLIAGIFSLHFSPLAIIACRTYTHWSEC